MLHKTIDVLFGYVHAPESSRRSVTHPSSGDHFDGDLLAEIPDLLVTDRPILRLFRVCGEESVRVRHPGFLANFAVRQHIECCGAVGREEHWQERVSLAHHKRHRVTSHQPLVSLTPSTHSWRCTQSVTRSPAASLTILAFN